MERYMFGFVHGCLLVGSWLMFGIFFNWNWNNDFAVLPVFLSIATIIGWILWFLNNLD